MSVDQQQHPAVVVARQGEPARPDDAVVAVVDDVHPADGAQNVRQRAVAIPRDLLRGDEGHRGRRLDRRLEPLGGAKDLPGVQRHQLLEAQIVQPRLGRCGGGQRERDGERGREGADGNGHFARGQRQQSRADLESSALGRLEVDVEAQLAVLEKELRDASQLCESLDIADREDRRVTQSGNELRRLTRCHAGDVQDVAPFARRPVGRGLRHVHAVARQRAALDRSLQGFADGCIAEHTEDQWRSGRSSHRPATR